MQGHPGRSWETDTRVSAKGLLPVTPRTYLWVTRDMTIMGTEDSGHGMGGTGSDAYCVSCGAKYDHESSPDNCSEPDCVGRVESASNEFGHLIQDVISSFTERFIEHYREYTDELYDTVDELSDRESELNQELRGATDDQEITRIRSDLNDVRDRQQVIQDHLAEVRSESYIDFLRGSRQSKYAFNMRNISTSVGLTLIEENYERQRLGDGDSGREMRMAMNELHPGAAYLHNGETYIVSRVSYDDYASETLEEEIAENETVDFGGEFVCPVCHATYSEHQSECEECDAEAALKRRQLAVMDSVEAFREDLAVSTDDGLEAREIHSESDGGIQSTFSDRDTSILSFEGEREFSLQDSTGEKIGTLQYGELDVLVHATGYRARYTNGVSDPQESLFERCGVEECPGIIVRNEDSNRCTVDSRHDPDGFDSPSEFVRLGHKYSTKGLKLNLESDVAEHTLAHGLRVSLQYLGGVDIREVSESVEDDVTYVFDSQEGGAKISQILVEEQEDSFPQFKEAMELIEDHLDCDCDRGCPMCVYQYGCDCRNDPQTLDRNTINDMPGPIQLNHEN